MLQPPSNKFRLAKIFVNFWGSDDETGGGDEIEDPGQQYYELDVSPHKLTNVCKLPDYTWGGEMRAEYTI